MARIIGYIRVSSTAKADHEDSVTAQKKRIQAWARREGHEVVGWHKDEGVSGGNGLDARAGLHAALDELRDGTAAGLVVSRLDRLARDLIVQETLLAEIRRLGGEPFTASAAEAEYLADDPDDPSRKLIRQILGSVAEYERALITFRLRSGKAAKRARGEYAGGFLGYGQVVVEGRLADNPAELAAIARARALRAQGKSYRAIAAMLTAEGHATKHGSTWWPRTVQRMLAAE